MTMGPQDGTPEYEEQAEQIRRMLRTIDAADKDAEDGVVLLFAMDPSYSRSAIMDGVGRWRTERRATTSR